MSTNTDFSGVDVSEFVDEVFACPKCGQRCMDLLEWVSDSEVACQTCGMLYEP